jgi:hypothetical protein
MHYLGYSRKGNNMADIAGYLMGLVGAKAL